MYFYLKKNFFHLYWTAEADRTNPFGGWLDQVVTNNGSDDCSELIQKWRSLGLGGKVFWIYNTRDKARALLQNGMCKKKIALSPLSSFCCFLKDEIVANSYFHYGLHISDHCKSLCIFLLISFCSSENNGCSNQNKGQLKWCYVSVEVAPLRADVDQ